MTQERDHARQQANAQMRSIADMVAHLHQADADDDDNARGEAIRAIQEDPLSIEVRSGWHSPGTDAQAEEYRILLCTGGPACQIVGHLSAMGEPETARIEYQDWGTPWAEYRLTDEQEAIVLEYARQFCFD